MSGAMSPFAKLLWSLLFQFNLVYCLSDNTTSARLFDRITSCCRSSLALVLVEGIMFFMWPDDLSNVADAMRCTLTYRGVSLYMDL